MCVCSSALKEVRRAKRAAYFAKVDVKREKWLSALNTSAADWIGEHDIDTVRDRVCVCVCVCVCVDPRSHTLFSRCCRKSHRRSSPSPGRGSSTSTMT